jgi:hypothetical protein
MPMDAGESCSTRDVLRASELRGCLSVADHVGFVYLTAFPRGRLCTSTATVGPDGQ